MCMTSVTEHSAGGAASRPAPLLYSGAMHGGPGPGRPAGGALARLRSESWFSEAQRKAIHLGFLVLPLELLHQWLPWPRGRSEWRLVVIAPVAAAIPLDVLRLDGP